MKRIVIFSQPEQNPNLKQILNATFPNSIQQKNAVFMPSMGIAQAATKYITRWQTWAAEYGVELQIVDNAAYMESPQKNVTEIQKIRAANILVISGGDTQVLLDNLRLSGMDSAIMAFWESEDRVLCGYSAGAMVLTPTIRIRELWVDNIPDRPEEEKIGLGFLDFEVFPHYDHEIHQFKLQKYRMTTLNEVKTLTNEEFLILDH